MLNNTTQRWDPPAAGRKLFRAPTRGRTLSHERLLAGGARGASRGAASVSDALTRQAADMPSLTSGAPRRALASGSAPLAPATRSFGVHCAVD
jgi:hypothetical protein